MSMVILNGDVSLSNRQKKSTSDFDCNSDLETKQFSVLTEAIQPSGAEV